MKIPSSIPERIGQSSFCRLLLGGFILICGLVITGCSRSNDTETAKSSGVAKVGSPAKKPVDKDALRLHVQSAKQKFEESIQKRAVSISKFVNSRMPGIKPFAEECTGWEATYEVIRGRGEKYVKRVFEEKVFKDADLAQVVQQALEDCVKDLEQIENELAVALEQELIGETIAEDKKSIAILSFRDAMKNLNGLVAAETGQAVTSSVSSEILSLLTGQILASLAVSTGTIGTSTFFSWGTLGVSIIVGIAVEYVWKWYDDPAGDIRRETSNQLSKMSQRLTSTVQTECYKFLEQRAGLWDKIVESK